MLSLVGLEDRDPADVLAGGGAMDTWRAMVRAQGGDPDAPLPRAPQVEVITAPTDGVLHRLDALALGIATWRLGAGRARKEDPVSPSAGIAWHATVGDTVTAGQPLLELHVDDPTRLPAALEALDGAWEIAPEPVAPPPLVLGRVS
jgi:thymidine phosphorylase